MHEFKMSREDLVDIYEVKLILREIDDNGFYLDFECNKVLNVIESKEEWSKANGFELAPIPKNYKLRDFLRIEVSKGFKEKPNKKELKDIEFEMSNIMLEYINNKQRAMNEIYNRKYSLVLSNRNKLTKKKPSKKC